MNAMNRSLVTLVLLAFLILALLSPFAALSMLLLVAIGSIVLMGVGIIVRSLFVDPAEAGEKTANREVEGS